jgi:GT2 family glycosyltransferase
MGGISIAICNYNRCELVTRCIEAAIDSIDRRLHINVVDNASTDGSVEAIKARFGRQVSLHVRTTNGGSAGGFAAAIEHALRSDPEFLLILDSDCIVHPDAIAVLEMFLHRNETFSLVGPLIYWPSIPPTVQEFGGTIDWPSAQCKGNYKNYNEESSPPLTGWRETDYVAACCLLVRASAVRSVGNIDPRYFLYFDDIDWQWRLRLAGHRIAVTADAKAVHHCGAANKSSHVPTYYHWRNRIHFFRTYAKNRKQALDIILSDAARAIATCSTLGLLNAANAIRVGVSDALNGVWLARDFGGVDISSDPPAKFDLKIASTRQVHHIFEGVSISDRDSNDVVLVDPYGKQLIASEAYRLSHLYRDTLQATTDEFSRLRGDVYDL